MDILVEPVDPARYPESRRVAASLAGHEPVAVATMVERP